MKTIDDINLYTWFTDRELNYIPKHFVMANTTLTTESREWVLEKLSGRFATVSHPFDYNTNNFPNVRIAFENPKEAVFFELTWS